MHKAMTQAQEKGKNQYQFYSNISRRIILEKDLYHALTHQQFSLCYQPQIDLGTGQVMGIEALIRWKHPIFGWVSPTEFIPIAEKSVMMTEITKWVLKTACIQNKRWHDQGLPKTRISVNISSVNFERSGLYELISKTLYDTKLEPHYLEVEITESVIIEDVERTVEILAMLQELGVRVAIDDFGTGNSSLAYLKDLPINTLKIDRSFIKDVPYRTKDATLVRDIIRMAQNLKLQVIAEGVENAEQVIFLSLHKCRLAQGYLFSKPLFGEEYEKLIHSLQDAVTAKVSQLAGQVAYESARLNELRFESLFHYNPYMVCSFDLDGHFLSVNQAAENMMGYQADELLYQSFMTIVAPEYVARTQQLFEKLEEGLPKNMETVIINKQGEFVHLDFTTLPIILDEKIVGVFGIAKNITERKRLTEEAIRNEHIYKNTKDLLDSFVTNTADAISMFDLKGNVIKVNRSFERIYGWKREEVLGKHIPIVPEELEDEARSIWKTLIQGEQVVDHVTLRKRKDGTLLHVSLTASPVRNEKGEIIGNSVISRDISSRKKSEELFLKTEKIAVIGELAAGIAHEIRNPLTSIKGFIKLLKQVHPDNKKYIDIIQPELNQIEHIIEELLYLSKPMADNQRKTDLCKLLEKMVSLIEPQATMKDIEIMMEIQPLPKLKCNGDKIKQVYLYILMNALEAMPNGGQLKVRTYTKEQSAIIRIEDNGKGIAKERLKKLGEPFYSTKEKGTGLGLTISNKIMQEHGGRIEIQSELGVGTVVEVILPINTKK